MKKTQKIFRPKIMAKEENREELNPEKIWEFVRTNCANHIKDKKGENFETPIYLLGERKYTTRREK